MTNRIGGPGPSEPMRGRGGPTEPDSKKFQEKMKKVEKVKEVEETELDKQKKRSLYTAPDDLNGDLESTEARSPSPFERDFMQPRSRPTPTYSKPKKGFEDLSREAIPSPPSTQTPQIGSPIPKVSSQPDSNLPQSDRFWEDFDMPDETPPPSRVFQERQSQQSQSQDDRRDNLTRPKDIEERKETTAEKKKKKEDSTSYVVGEKSEKAEAGQGHQKKKEEDEGMLKGPLTGAVFEEEKKEKKGSKEPGKKGSSFLIGDQLEQPRTDEGFLEKPYAPIARAEEKKEKKREGGATIPVLKREKDASSEERTQAPPQTVPMKKEEEDQAAPMAPSAQPEAKTSKDKEDGEGEKQKAEAISSITLPSPLPSQIEQTVQTAQTAVASYLNPTTAALFHQMVGAILYLAPTTPGISRTEVVLNSQNMLNSPFYNSKILLEKYASAPDSFNVRLTGTPQAVKIFNDNMQGLMSAFTAAYHENRLRFRIGRFETAIETERPLIRRKKETGSQDEAGERGG